MGYLIGISVYVVFVLCLARLMHELFAMDVEDDEQNDERRP